LSAVARLKERFGSTYVVDFLRGSKSVKIREEHKELKTYGAGADISRPDWIRYFNELVARGYLRISDDGYHILKLTPKSDAVLKGTEKVELIAAQVFEEAEQEEITFDTDLMHLLRMQRQEIAMRENLPAYIILSDATLLEIATYLPQNMDELHLISGFGDVKLARYGRDFLNAINAYSKEHGLISKMDQKAKKRERKPKAKTARVSDTFNVTYKLYKEGKTIAEIAAERGLSPTTIEGHLSNFIQTGELDIAEFVIPDKIPVIQSAVESYGNEKLSPLKEILGDNYSYGEIKAVIAWLNYKQKTDS
jgi:ATP-dependent DNA helicase RecQ